MTLVLAGNNLIGTIPANFVSLRGVEYYIQLADGQTTAFFPANDPVNNPAVIAVRAARANFPLAIQFILQIKVHGLKSGWRDEQNFAGLLTNATKQLDHCDILEAPPLGDHMRLSLVEEYVSAGHFRAISTLGEI